VIQVDVRGERIGRRVPVDVPLVGTVKDTVDALLPLITAKRDSAHLDRMTAHYRRARGRMDRQAEAGRHSSPLHPQYVAATIDRLAADDAVFTADVGTPCIWAARDTGHCPRKRYAATGCGRTRGSTLASPLISRPRSVASAAVSWPANRARMSWGSPARTRSGAAAVPSRVVAEPPDTSTTTGSLAVRKSGLGVAPAGTQLTFGGFWATAQDGFRFTSPRILRPEPGIQVAQGYDFCDLAFITTSDGVVAIDAGTRRSCLTW
jgi:hypothetical protein